MQENQQNSLTLETLKREEPTIQDFKRFNKQFITRILPIVPACGHNINPDELPHNHCDHCLFAFFNQDGETVASWHEEYKTDKQAMIAKYGTNFVKQYVRFMSTAVKLAKEHGEEARIQG